MIRFTILLTCLIIISCGKKELTLEPGENHFGSVINEEGATFFTGIETGLSEGDTIDIKLKGSISEVCQAKGCWMNLIDQKGQSKVFVKFKDYAFFVPKNAGGHDAIVEGKVYVEETSVEELKHYAADRGASQEELAAITEPKKEVKMMAEGVIIYSD